MNKVYKNKKILVLFSIVFTISLIMTVLVLQTNIFGATSEVSYVIQNDWKSGAEVNVTIKNVSSSTIDGWNLTWTFANNQKITDMWNASYTQSGNSVTVKSLSWNKTIPANSSVNFGFNMTYSGSNTVPTDFTVNGTSTSPITSITPTTTITSTSTSSTVPTSSPVVTPTPTSSGQTTQIKGSEVLLIGESFIAMSHDITKYLQENARNAGVISSSDSFRDFSVSGTTLAGGGQSIPNQYKDARQKGPVKYVVMDGGGNDCLLSSSSTFTSSSTEVVNATNALKGLLTQMNTDGVLKVVYFFYPDPQGSLGSSGLKSKLDVLRPLIQNIVTTSSSPKGYWLDLRPTFEGKYGQYIQGDGIHPTAAGSKATADALWGVIQQNGVFK